MTVTPKRPPALKHLSSQAASIALAKHFGDIAKAAKELNINRTDLRKLTWHNPRILNAAHERDLCCFILACDPKLWRR